ncbi:MAG TPA: methyltransferase domain-containing protein [Anaerolineales bacterium]|nr:methyltransferase domain-containing protein [Anaerolineales bacterium]
MDIRAYNRKAWDAEVEKRSPWTIPVSHEEIAQARRGDWRVLLTEQKPAPPGWFPPMGGLETLALASGGGQQAPIFAAAGAEVTVLDNSPRQLDRDREVAEREGLHLKLIEGDMRDLSMFADSSFDFIFHPVSNLFVPEVRPVWEECFRVLRRGGTMLAGMMNPIFYIFDWEKAERGILEVAHKLPYADSDHPEIMKKMMEKSWPLEHSHSLSDQLGGQMDAGFHLIGLYESHHSGTVISDYTPTYIATRALKP